MAKNPYIEALEEELAYSFSYDELADILLTPGRKQIPLELVIHFGMHEFRNSAADIQAYFSTKEKPVKDLEMILFWRSLCPLERIQYKDVDLEKLSA